MKAIRIVATPPGQAPKYVREAWVGLVLPVSLVTEEEIKKRQLVLSGVLGGAPDKENMDGFSVKTEDAFTQLSRSGREAAAQWWKQHIHPEFMPYLMFGKRFCEECEIT